MTTKAFDCPHSEHSEEKKLRHLRNTLDALLEGRPRPPQQPGRAAAEGMANGAAAAEDPTTGEGGPPDEEVG